MKHVISPYLNKVHIVIYCVSCVLIFWGSSSFLFGELEAHEQPIKTIVYWDGGKYIQLTDTQIDFVLNLRKVSKTKPLQKRPRGNRHLPRQFFQLIGKDKKIKVTYIVSLEKLTLRDYEVPRHLREKLASLLKKLQRRPSP